MFDAAPHDIGDCADVFCPICRALPRRRQQMTGVFEWLGIPYEVSAGFNWKGYVGEIFVRPLKSTVFELTVQDCAIAVSHLLQAPRRLDDLKQMFSTGVDPLKGRDRESLVFFLIRSATALEAEHGAAVREFYLRAAARNLTTADRGNR